MHSMQTHTWHWAIDGALWNSLVFEVNWVILGDKHTDPQRDAVKNSICPFLVLGTGNGLFFEGDIGSLHFLDYSFAQRYQPKSEVVFSFALGD